MMYKIWAFSEQELLNYQEKIENATIEEIKAAESLYGNSPLPEILTINGNKAQIRIYGPLSQKGPSPIARFFGFGGTGYLQIIEAINKISDNESIEKIELLTNTPGGEVLGVDKVFQAVKDLSEKKEVTAINQGMIASAGYWIASATGKIISESPVNLTGSIGVIITAVDTKKLEERFGVRVVTVVSRNAPNKNPDVTKKSGIAEIQRVADSIERVFIQRISEGRNLPIEHIEKFYGRGGLLVSLDPDGTDAIDVKMIDEVITEKEKEEKKDEIDNFVTGGYIVEKINGIKAEWSPQDILAPFANEHSARLLSPTISKIRVRRTSGSGKGTVQGVKIPESIDIIWFVQRLKGREVPRAQSLRFPVSTWTESEARSWIKKKKIKTILFEPAKKTKSENVNTPANSAGKNKQEVIMPTLTQFLAENPTAQAEYDKALKEKYKAGVEVGKKEIREDIKKISPYLTSSKYDEAVKAISVKALNGEVTIDSVITTVTMEDMRKEKQNSDTAKTETEKIGDTKAEQHETGSGNGEINTEADFKAEIARVKGVA